MISSRKLTCCCYTLIFLVIHLTASFSVEELCARRCLYGRGGVLCNCNARHFTGKRSGQVLNHNRYLQVIDNPENLSQFPEDVLTEDNSFVSETDQSLQERETLSHEDKQKGFNSLPGAYSQRRKLEDSVSRFIEKADSNMEGIMADENDEKSSINKKDSNEIRLLLMQDGKPNDQDNAEGERNEKASKVKLIMADPYLDDDHPGLSEDATDHIEDDFPHISISAGKNLLQLQHILSRALRGR